MTTNQTAEDAQSFFRRWRPLILLGVLIVMGAGAARLFMDHRANSPIVDPYLAVIDQMSLQSPRARQRLEQYYAKHQRQTVASKHYPRLCQEMLELAAEDGIPTRLLLDGIATRLQGVRPDVKICPARIVVNSSEEP